MSAIRPMQILCCFVLSLLSKHVHTMSNDSTDLLEILWHRMHDYAHWWQKHLKFKRGSRTRTRDAFSCHSVAWLFTFCFLPFTSESLNLPIYLQLVSKVKHANLQIMTKPKSEQVQVEIVWKKVRVAIVAWSLSLSLFLDSRRDIYNQNFNHCRQLVDYTKTMQATKMRLQVGQILNCEMAKCKVTFGKCDFFASTSSSVYSTKVQCKWLDFLFLFHFFVLCLRLSSKIKNSLNCQRAAQTDKVI
jgi:hypothetical protein